MTTEEKTKQANDKVIEVKNAIKAKKHNIKETEKEIYNIEQQVADMNKALDEVCNGHRVVTYFHIPKILLVAQLVPLMIHSVAKKVQVADNGFLYSSVFV